MLGKVVAILFWGVLAIMLFGVVPPWLGVSLLVLLAVLNVIAMGVHGAQ